jgi:ABC-type antimicrobial peptide transport system permease subunit
MTSDSAVFPRLGGATADAPALLLVAIGLYGVLAYSVTQRTRELGIRMALGAQARDVLRMVMGQGVRLAAVGLLIGAVGSYALTRTIASLLFDVKPTDPAVFVLVSLVLGIVVLAAAAAPSWRATHIDPLQALRQD